MVRVQLASLLLLAVVVADCRKEPRPLAPETPYTLDGGVVVQVLRRGDGRHAKKGDKLSIHFVGTLLDGGLFDSSRKRDAPFGFWVGEGLVVKGLDSALLGAQEGDLRLITVPADLGYGTDSLPNIPPNSTLVFDVEVLDVR